LAACNIDDDDDDGGDDFLPVWGAETEFISWALEGIVHTIIRGKNVPLHVKAFFMSLQLHIISSSCRECQFAKSESASLYFFVHFSFLLASVVLKILVAEGT
jgi:hypothetical protein